MPTTIPAVLRVASFVLLLALMVAGGAWAGPATDQLRGNVEKVIKIVEDPTLKQDGRIKERRAAIRQVANEIFDFNEVSKRSMGRYWQARTPAEQQEFTQTFTDLLEYTYISRIEGYSGEKVQFVGEQPEGDYAVVKTKIVTHQGVEIPVDYRMFSQSGRWRAYDVNIEGVSLVANYRTQFNAILQRSSYAELIKALRAKVEKIDVGASKGGTAKGRADAAPGGRPAGQTP